MPVLQHPEFGRIVVRRSPLARAFKASVAPNGELRISAPSAVPMLGVKSFIATSKKPLRELLASQQPSERYSDGMQVGKSHTLSIRHGATLAVARRGTQLIATVPPDDDAASPRVQAEIRKSVIAALRREAAAYLPRRVAHLAVVQGVSYRTLRFSHAGTRWGSCSSNGVISLNIALMKLDLELIDYVIIHELAHTRQMNHSAAFWEIVAHADPDYKLHRKILTTMTPIC